MGETASALKKGQVGPHKSEVGALFKGHHIEIGMYEREELDGLEAKIDAELKKAGGANYDLGNTRTGLVGSGAGSYKNRSKVSECVGRPPRGRVGGGGARDGGGGGGPDGRGVAHPPQTPKQAFFEQKDKETEVSVVYDKGPLRRKSAGFTTVNLSGRQMVASAADAQKNTVDTDVTEKVVTKKLAETSLAEAGKPAEKAEEAPAAEAPAAEEPAPPAEEAEKPE